DAYDIAAGLFGAVAEGEVAGALYFAEGIDAASHLFAALCGLDEFARGPREGASLPGECDGLAAAGELSQPGGRGALGAPGLPDALAACWARALSEARKAACWACPDPARCGVIGLSSALSAADASASTAALAQTAVGWPGACSAISSAGACLLPARAILAGPRRRSSAPA
ncbi:MAG: hypothetical protein ACLUW6_09455, partial [Coriobacteriaceae bacterium]